MNVFKQKVMNEMANIFIKCLMYTLNKHCYYIIQKFLKFWFFFFNSRILRLQMSLLFKTYLIYFGLIVMLCSGDNEVSVFCFKILMLLVIILITVLLMRMGKEVFKQSKQFNIIIFNFIQCKARYALFSKFFSISSS